MISSPSLILWLDPGLATGWAAWRPAARLFTSGHITGVLAAGELIDELLSLADGGAAIGCEGFTIRPGSSRLRLDTTALEVIGVAKWVAHQTGSRVLPQLQPDARKLGEKHLRTVGWHRPGPDHMKSASSHLLSYLLQERQLPADLLAKITRKQEEEE
jgi:hypothetical protein